MSILNINTYTHNNKEIMFLLKLKMKNSSAASPMAGLTTTATAIKKYAVVTGGNKGIGLDICRQLASQGVSVVLTARNERRGLEAVEKLKKSGLSDYIMFHQLDVTDLGSIDSLAEYIKSQIGKLDILVNNAGINGVTDSEAGGAKTKRTAYELSAECLQINYYGTKRTTETLIPLLELSDSPRVVNISSTMGRLGTIRTIQTMAEATIHPATQRYALVTGGIKESDSRFVGS